MKDRSSHEILPDDKPVPFFPDHLMTEFWVAMGFLGAPYRFGGSSVTGIDCSAFVKKIYHFKHRLHVLDSRI